MPTQLTLTHGRTSAGGSLLTVAGEIDMSNSTALADAIDDVRGPLVVDLTGVEYLDSAGLNVLFAHAERLEIVATPLLQPVLAVSGLARLVEVRLRPDDDTGTPPR
ncbi:STAS domain-containing protein [Streptomyces asoensis]|uniref:STAS domain-containing protein n=1 Tax=Streptomyces sp. MBT97 TaxID=2800411 RepID=UPI00190BC506|nr:STAS domain-containing protein [Streptomyces sp. MBT97]MBK3636186.1 STAS domain-containing protein [Streptomyces sp. MBT97]